MSRYYYNGTVEFKKNLSKKDKEDILDTLGLDDSEVTFEEKSVSVSGFAYDDLDSSLDELCDLLPDNPVVSGDISYDGDYTGGIIFDPKDGCFYEYDSEQLGIKRASAERLIEELVSRGVLKKTGENTYETAAAEKEAG